MRSPVTFLLVVLILLLIAGVVLAQDDKPIFDISVTNNFINMITALSVTATAVFGFMSLVYGKRNAVKLEQIHQVTNSNFSAQREEIQKLNETVAALLAGNKVVIGAAATTAAVGHPSGSSTLSPTTETIVPTTTTIKTEPTIPTSRT